MTAGISSVDMFNILRQKIGETEAKTLTEYVESEVNRQFENKLSILATKDDVYNTREGLKEDIYALRVDMREQKVDLLKWLFGFFLALALMIIGLYLKR